MNSPSTPPRLSKGALALALLAVVAWSALPMQAQAQSPEELCEFVISNKTAEINPWHVTKEGELISPGLAEWTITFIDCYYFWESFKTTGGSLYEVTDFLPPFTSITDWEATHGDFNPASGVWSIFEDLDPDGVATLTIVTELEASGLFENCAAVTFVDKNSNGMISEDCASVFNPQRRPGPNFERGVGEILARGGRRFASDLAVALEASNEAPASGDEITLTVSVTNHGPQTNGGVEVDLSMDDCLSVTASNASHGSFSEGTWDIGTFPVGTATLELTVTVGACGGATEVEAEVTGHLPDPNDNPLNPFEEETQDDNEASLTLSVSGASARVVDLGRAYPNPFNPQTVIPFELAEASEVQVAVFDVLGRRVAILVDGVMSAGRHEALFTARGLPTGTYLVRLEAAGQVQTQRIVLMK